MSFLNPWIPVGSFMIHKMGITSPIPVFLRVKACLLWSRFIKIHILIKKDHQRSSMFFSPGLDPVLQNHSRYFKWLKRLKMFSPQYLDEEILNILNITPSPLGFIQMVYGCDSALHPGTYVL